MRQSTVYVIAISCMTSVFVLCIVKQPKWPTNAFETLKKSYYIHTESGVLTKLSPDITDLISSKSYYQKLCEQDRARMKTLRQIDSKKSTMDKFHSIVMDTFDTVCNVKTRLGGRYLPKCHVMDGQKYVCMDDLMEDIQNNECIVYSFGVGNDISFEKTFADMGCKVFAYDPTINHSKHKFESISFKKIGVVGVPGKDKNYQTLNEIFKNNGHVGTKISYLKLDIEEAELTGLPVWLASGALENVQQIAMEVHLKSLDPKVTLDFLEHFIDLQLKGDFRIFNWEANNCWKNLNKKIDYFGLSEIVLKKINPENLCVR